LYGLPFAYCFVSFIDPNGYHRCVGCCRWGVGGLGLLHDIAALIQRHDSIQSAHRAEQIRRGIADSASSDSLSQWDPLTDQDLAADSVAKAATKSSSGKKQPPSGPVNINTASKAELMRLPGVGEKTAEAIIGHRNARKFSAPADIMNVKGIGPKKYEKMLPFLKVK
jgi:competence ComEA-like helix-hairpin-helix protein